MHAGPRWQLTDLRAEADPLAALSELNLGDYAVWAEGVATSEIPFDAERITNRADPQNTPTLIIWSTPPGVNEMEQMLASTGARQVIVIAKAAPSDSAEGFIKRLVGLVKYAQRAYEGEIFLPRLAAAMGQREFTVRLGLDWLAAKGQISVEWLDGERAQITEGGEPDPTSLEEIQGTIGALLMEAAAYRAYFRKADLSTFFSRP